MKSKFSIIAAGAVGLLSLQAMASTAANTVISNTATVKYNDAGGLAQTPVDSLPVNVTVTLVPSAVTLSSPANQAIAQGTSATLTYTITSTANGFDTYNLSSTATASNDSAVTPTFPANITLGGTTLAAAANAGDTAITVPYDGIPGSTVNGLSAGSVVVVGANAYTVATVTKNSAANTVTIALSAAIAGAAQPIGAVVGERKTFTETVASGTVTTGPSGSQTVSTTVVSATLPAATATQATPTVITVNRPTLSVTKLVSTDNGATFGASGNAQPGTVLIYKIIASNTGVTDASAVTFSDVVPQYLTYQAGTAKYATASATTYSAATGLTEGTGGYNYAANTVAYNPASAGSSVGTVPGGSVLVLFFQAKIN